MPAVFEVTIVEDFINIFFRDKFAKPWLNNSSLNITKGRHNVNQLKGDFHESEKDRSAACNVALPYRELGRCVF